MNQNPLEKKYKKKKNLRMKDKSQNLEIQPFMWEKFSRFACFLPLWLCPKGKPCYQSTEEVQDRSVEITQSEKTEKKIEEGE